MKSPTPFIDEIVENCLAARVRMIGRAVTAIYERAVSGHGVTIAQVNLLAALGKLGPSAPSRLGQVLQLERSTVSRNLDILLENGWVRAVSSDDKGVKEVALTAAGRKKIESLMEAWRGAQKEAAKFLGEDGVRAVHAVADSLWEAGVP
jgi:DNA-binding MarR family transcriptional regulator